ncbi:intracellular septation protein [Fontimonas thermophila]|uniref:Inner membrane-spanning protein YciB n=1 Tax=Fontimonas thermophila TaxID=1076937 RepID=A0A1I2I071_9GAMM|nr:septation protein IspZ [Fontimonas thermophila]SFF34246.1 intracellular septation protein [Fontimonas thermophila]
MNLLLDFAPALLFFGAYYAYGIYVATAVLIVALFALVAVYWFKERRLHKAHLLTALAAAALGGLTLWIRDPAFIQYKPTAVYAVFALALLLSHIVGDKVLLARLPQKSISLPDPVWRKVNLAWAVFFAGCAVLNVYIAHHFSEKVWVQFKTFGFTGLMFVFLIAHLPFLKQYLPQEEEP